MTNSNRRGASVIPEGCLRLAKWFRAAGFDGYLASDKHSEVNRSPGLLSSTETEATLGTLGRLVK